MKYYLYLEKDTRWQQKHIPVAQEETVERKANHRLIGSEYHLSKLL